MSVHPVADVGLVGALLPHLDMLE